VIFFWRQDRYPVQTWLEIRQQVDPEHRSMWIMEGTDLAYLNSFDGNHLYSVAWDPEPEGTLFRWGERVRQWSEQHGAFKVWVATVMPGYDDRPTGRSDAFVRDRAGGLYYRRCWQGASESGADWVMITSFNEWMEGTQIEPSVGYGDAYLDLTRELADGFRAGQAAAPPLVPATPSEPTAPPAPSLADPTSSPTVPAAAPTAPPAPSPLPASTPTPAITLSPTPASSASSTATSLPAAWPSQASLAGLRATPEPTTPLPAPTPLASAASVAQGYAGLIAAGLGLALLLAVTWRRRR